jgi:putative component of toxin-antitoxin plasmid stabilization module
LHVIESIKSRSFDTCMIGLRDRRAAALIQARLDRLAMGNPSFATVIKVARALGLRVAFPPA